MTNSNITTLAAETCALILAAGLGSRLGTNTKEQPKCLVPVAGIPMLQRMLDNLSKHGIRSVVIAVGYLAPQIQHFVAQHYPQLEVSFVENPNYSVTGSVFSLDLALQAVSTDHHLLLIEGDVVLEPELLRRTLTAASVAPDAVTLLAAYEPALSGTFALIEDGRVTAWAHESVRSNDFPLLSAHKTVNVTWVRKAAALTALRNAVKHTIAAKGPKAPLEYAMQSLVEQGMHIGAVSTLDMRWFEVDTPEDLEIADRLFA